MDICTICGKDILMDELYLEAKEIPVGSFGFTRKRKIHVDCLGKKIKE